MKAEEGILYVQVSIPVGRGWQKAEVIYTANNTIELAVEILNRLYRKESYISVRGKSVSSSWWWYYGFPVAQLKKGAQVSLVWAHQTDENFAIWMGISFLVSIILYQAPIKCSNVWHIVWIFTPLFDVFEKCSTRLFLGAMTFERDHGDPFVRTDCSIFPQWKYGTQKELLTAILGGY